MNRTIVLGTAFLSGILVLGCSSSKSTLLYQDGCDTHWHSKHSTGVPVTLEVPTYVKLTIVEKRYLVDEVTKKDGTETTSKSFLKDGNSTLISHDIRQDIINTKKIFTVDLKRPAAGTWESESSFEGQYFKSIKHKGNDITISTVGDQVDKLLKNVIPLIPKAKPTDSGTQPEDPNKRGTGQTLESVVAVGMFKLEDPDLEVKVTQFICDHCKLGGGTCGAITLSKGDPKSLPSIPTQSTMVTPTAHSQPTRGQP